MNDNSTNYDIKVTGEFWIESFDKYGSLLDERHQNNLVVTTGLSHILNQLFAANQTSDKIAYVSLGEGTNAPTAGDTTLGSDLGEGIVAGFVRQKVSFSSNQTGKATLIATFGPDDVPDGGVDFAHEITEFGLFTAANPDTPEILPIMFNRAVIKGINKQLGGAVKLTLRLTFSADG